MRKSEIVDAVYEQVGGFSKREAADLVDAVFEAMKNALSAHGDTVKIAGFGNFSVHEKGARPGRNPRTGQSVMIEERRAIVFRPSPALRDALNQGD
jgi:integration host factor subunit alpha